MPTHEPLPLHEFIERPLALLPSDFTLSELDPEDLASCWLKMFEEPSTGEASDQSIAIPSTIAGLTQSQLLSQWRTDFETPLASRTQDRLNLPLTPRSPILFSVQDDTHHQNLDLDDDYEYVADEELFGIPSQSTRAQRNVVEAGSPTRKRTLDEPAPLLALSFSTASGKRIKSPSKKSLASAQKIIEQVADSLEVPSMDSEAKEPLITAFTTASGKKIKSPSKKSLEQAQKIVNDEIASSISKSTSPSAAGFATASGKSIQSPSKTAKDRAQRIMKESEHLFDQETPKAKRILPTGDAFRSNRTPLAQTGPSHRLNRNLGFPTPFSNKKESRNIERNTLLSKSSPITPIIKPKMVEVFDTRQRASRVQLSDCTLVGTDLTNSAFDFQRTLLHPVLQSASHEWLQNHLFFVLWKLYSYSGFGIADIYRDLSPCSFSNIERQLLYRYQKEVLDVKRSILKKIVERDDTPSRHMVLFISEIGPKEKITMSVSDGWYKVPIVIDEYSKRLVIGGKLKIGQKVRVAYAQLQGEEAVEVLEAGKKGVSLLLHGNSLRPAPWSAKLGIHKSMFTVSLDSLSADGGTVCAVDVVVVRRFANLYAVEYSTGNKEVFSEASFEDAKISWEANQVEIQSIRLVTRFRVADCCGCPRKREAIITIWNSNEHYDQMIKEGKRFIIMGLRVSNDRSRAIRLAWGKSTMIVEKQNVNPPVGMIRQLVSLDDCLVQEDYDIEGVLLGKQSESLNYLEWGESFVWLLWRDQANQLRLIALKVAVRCPKGVKSLSTLCFRDVTYLYMDPRGGFPVFLNCDHSQCSVAENGALLTEDDEDVIEGLKKIKQY